jgi:hypothetical protein
MLAWGQTNHAKNIAIRLESLTYLASGSPMQYK